MKLSTAHKIGRFFQYFVLILVGVIMIYPLVWMVGATFKSNAEIFAGIGFLTANPTLQGYIDAVTQNYGGDISIWRASSTPTASLSPRSSSPLSARSLPLTASAVLSSRAAICCSAS